MIQDWVWHQRHEEGKECKGSRLKIQAEKENGLWEQKKDCSGVIFYTMWTEQHTG